jgi:hypothetical protein
MLLRLTSVRMLLPAVRGRWTCRTASRRPTCCARPAPCSERLGRPGALGRRALRTGRLPSPGPYGFRRPRGTRPPRGTLRLHCLGRPGRLVGWWPGRPAQAVPWRSHDAWRGCVPRGGSVARLARLGAVPRVDAWRGSGRAGPQPRAWATRMTRMRGMRGMTWMTRMLTWPAAQGVQSDAGLGNPMQAWLGCAGGPCLAMAWLGCAWQPSHGYAKGCAWLGSWPCQGGLILSLSVWPLL